MANQNDTHAQCVDGQALPCPFCGSAPRVDDDTDGTCNIYCTDCGLSSVHSPTQDDALEFWNRRTASRTPAGTEEMNRFLAGFILGALFSATIGTILAMNIDSFCMARGGCWFVYNSEKSG